jgi:NADP-dependent 3-hydroxy acid dehydrogenase YdfG
MAIAWLTGATGAWGGAFLRALRAAGFDVVSLGRRAPDGDGDGDGDPFIRLDLSEAVPALSDLLAALPDRLAAVPDVLVHAAVAVEGDRAALARADFLGPAALVSEVADAMTTAGHGRIAVLVPQNARLGLRGMGDVAGAQAALWTWAEALAEELRGTADVRLTVVIPPRTASPTQAFVSGRTGHSARLRPADAAPLLRAVLAGRRRAGRRPLLAAAAMLR